MSEMYYERTQVHNSLAVHCDREKKTGLRGVCLQLFIIFPLDFGKSKNGITPKVKNCKHIFISFSSFEYLKS
jgi:hypothetical protein